MVKSFWKCGKRITIRLGYLLAWLTPVFLPAQDRIDTVLQLPTLEVQAPRMRTQPVGSPVKNWTQTSLKSLPHTNLADLLEAETGVYIKSYGLGSQATTAVRGGSAGHTLILWNGLPIQSPMLGQLDLALLPLPAFESVQFQAGGNASLWGSGAIGGVINLDNQVANQPTTNVESETRLGSFGFFQQNLRLHLSEGRLQSTSRMGYQQARNDFPYSPAPGQAERRQTNAAQRQRYWLHDLRWQLNNQQQLSLHFWQQGSERKIPPTTVQTLSEAYQEDRATRVLAVFDQTLNDKIQGQFKTGFFKEGLDFYDPQIRLASESSFQTILGEVNLNWRPGASHQVLLGHTQIHTQAWADNYETPPQEFRLAFFGSWKYRTKNWQAQLSLRQEWIDAQPAPLLPSLGVSWQIDRHWSVAGRVSRNYRFPTLNDRYWQPGGNPALRPESGWSQEFTLEHQSQSGKQWQIEGRLTGFHRQIEDWILWVPAGAQNFWSANNVTRVWSRGLEARLELRKNWSQGSLSWRSGYDFIRSTNELTLNRPDLAAGAQLIYTPIHQAFASMQIKWKNASVYYRHRYTGPTQGINESIPGFQLGQLRAQYRLYTSIASPQFFFEVHNLWNADYVVVERRPMPGRYFRTGIRFKLNPKITRE